MSEERAKYETKRQTRPARKPWRTMTAGDKRLAGKLWAKLATEHRGAEHARKVEDLAKDFDVAKNTIRKCVFYLIESHKVPIGASLSGDQRGYYIITNAQEAEHSLAIPRARATENFVYYNALALALKQSNNMHVEQLSLGLEMIK
jgi:hypothetical protein